MTLTAAERKQIADLLRVAASSLRDLCDRGPRQSVALGDALLEHAKTADNLRIKLESNNHDVPS